MRKFIYTVAALAIAFLTLTLARPALANQTPGWDMKVATAPGPSFETCDNLKGWFVNDDENSADDPQGDLRPEPTVDGLKFTGKDLIHRKLSEPLALVDAKGGSFTATGDTDKVVMKWETTAPYATIVRNPEGKFWSSKIPASDAGGQSNPVDTIADLIGKTAPGGKTFTDDTKITTFGVGYWTESGTTVVSAITFHGEGGPLTCQPPVTTPPTTKATPTASHTVTAKPSTSSPSHPVGGAAAGGGSSGGALAITGPSGGVIAGVAGALVFFGALALWAVRKRKQTFVA